MKMTNRQIIDAIAKYNIFQEKKLPQKISFAIMRNYSKLNAEYKFYEGQLTKLFNDYKDKFKKDEDGNVQTYPNGIPMIDDEFAGDFAGELEDLLNAEIEVNISYVPIDALDYEDNGKYDILTVNELSTLSSILCETID